VCVGGGGVGECASDVYVYGECECIMLLQQTTHELKKVCVCVCHCIRLRSGGFSYFFPTFFAKGFLANKASSGQSGRVLCVILQGKSKYFIEKMAARPYSSQDEQQKYHKNVQETSSKIAPKWHILEI